MPFVIEITPTNIINGHNMHKLAYVYAKKYACYSACLTYTLCRNQLLANALGASQQQYTSKVTPIYSLIIYLALALALEQSTDLAILYPPIYTGWSIGQYYYCLQIFSHDARSKILIHSYIHFYLLLWMLLQVYVYNGMCV